VRRGSRSPCQYEKLHHVKSLREEISELQAELVEVKNNAPLNASALTTSPRSLEPESNDSYEWPWFPTPSIVLRTDQSAVGSSATDSTGRACDSGCTDTDNDIDGQIHGQSMHSTF
jgi:hypothetical protein